MFGQKIKEERDITWLEHMVQYCTFCKYWIAMDIKYWNIAYNWRLRTYQDLLI